MLQPTNLTQASFPRAGLPPLAPTLVWEVTLRDASFPTGDVRVGDPRCDWIYYVDAQSGEQFFNHSACTPEQGEAMADHLIANGFTAPVR